MRKIFSIVFLLIIGSSLASAASWYTWPQIWGKDETHPESVNLSRAQQESLIVVGNVGNILESEKDPTALRSAVTRTHGAGLKIIGQIFNNILSKDNPDAAGLLVASVEAVKFNGQHFQDWYITPCTNQPAWRNYLKEVVQGMAAAGVDGLATIYGDNLAERCFCSSCEAGFRSYLKDHYTSAELAALGIADINTFDYSDFLNSHGVTQMQIDDGSDKTSIPLYEDFRKMQEQLSAGYLDELIATARTYGGSGLIFMNCREGPDLAKFIRFPTLEAYSFYTNFDPLNPIFSYKENTQAPYYKIMRAMNPAAAILSEPVDESMGGIIANVADPNKYCFSLIAEALANRVSFYDLDRVGLWNGQVLGWSIDPEVNLKIKTFMRDNYDAFVPENLQSCAQIAVLYSARSQLKADRLRPGTAEESIIGMGRALSKAGFQYDIIFNGDGSLRSENLTLSTLSPYELVVIPGTIALTANEKSTLLSYVNSGGKLIAYGEVDSSFSLSAGETSYGSGQIFYEPDPLPKYYNGTALTTYLSTIEAQVSRYSSGKIVSGIDQTSIISQVWKTANPQRVYLHLINHDFSHQAADLSIDLELPSNFGVDKIFLTSPDLNGARLLAHAQSGQRVSFTVPELDTWDLITIFSTQEAQQAAQRSSLINSLSCGPIPASTSAGFYYNLAESSTITLNLYSILGENIRALSASYDMPNYNNFLNWDLKNYSGSIVPNGVYYYFFEARGQSGKVSRQRGKLIILK